MNKILEIIAEYWEAFKVFTILEPTEGGVHLRFGHYLRHLSEGIWFKFPLIDTFCITEIAIRCESLLTQTIGDKVVSTAVRYQIKDPKPYILELGNDDNYLQNITLGIVRLTIERNFTMSAEDIQVKILPEVRNAVNKFGFKIHDVFFVDFGRTKSLRLIVDNLTDA